MFFNKNSNSSCHFEEESKPLYKIILENISGDFIVKNKITVDPHGLNILNSINKDGSYCFGTKLKNVKNLFLNFILNILGK